jgi:putative membrane protein
MRTLVIRWLVLTLAVFLTTKLSFLGITCDSFGTLLVTALVLGILNAIVRPILLLLSLPFVLVTLGLFILVVNALLFYWLGSLVEGFHVPSFWSALGGSLVVSVVNVFFGGRAKTKSKVEIKTYRTPQNTRPSPPPGKGPVIDI